MKRNFIGREIAKVILTIGLILIFIGCASTDTSLNNNLRVYNAYGNTHRLFVHGRSLEKANEDKNVSKDASGYSNAWDVINLFCSNELENRKVFLTIDDVEYETKSDDEGYFEFNISSSNPFKMGYKEIELHLENNLNEHHTKATIIDNQKLVGIISDVDDTVVVSDVTNKIKLLVNIFWKNYKQREVILGMADRFKKILAENPPVIPSRLFFLSGSPKQLFTPIEKFLEYNHFPKHVIILKQLNGEMRDPLTDQIAYKTKKIEELIALYPNMQWIMFGDSGEEDAEIYAAIKKRYPTKVKAYYIRDVESGNIALY